MLEQIYEQYHDKVLRYIYGKVNDMYLAEDLCSDVFLKVTEKLDSFDASKASISTWIFTITRNTLTDHYRTRKIHVEIPETMSDDSDVEESICKEQDLELLAAALEKLDQRQRDIIIFRYYSGMTMKAIAEKMGISYAYVKVLYNKGIANLRKYFEQ